ncbi:MAG: hypothetical protein EBR23_13505, partial [Planctomycetia bacterium]|nr:hypothetical protein [Planctomycetia bacterium]
PLPRNIAEHEREWCERLAAHCFREPARATQTLTEFIHGPAADRATPRTRELAWDLVPRLLALCPDPTSESRRKSAHRTTAAARAGRLAAPVLSDPDRVLARLRPLWRLARDRGAQVHVDMESHATKDLTFDIFKHIATEDEFRDWPHCGVVVQCYLHETPRDLAMLAEWARKRGTPVWIRLVKGAYWDYETIHARAAGWPVPVWAEKWQTDACYEAATTFVMEHADVLRPALGSHNLRSLAHGMAVAEHLGLDRRGVEMQMLHGMGDPEKEAVTAAGWRMRVYMPYGQLVPGMAYLVRRLLENSSNDSFLRAGFVKHVPPEMLLAPPRAPAVAPDPCPPPTADEFCNEPLADFAIEANRRGMERAVAQAQAAFAAGPVLVTPMIAGVRDPGGERFVRRDPADHGRAIAEVAAASAETALRAVDVAHEALP